MRHNVPLPAGPASTERWPKTRDFWDNRPVSRSAALWLSFLVVLTCAAYGPVYDAGFLDYDDPWLIEHNPHFAPHAWDTPIRAFVDLTHEGRMSFGAEYLPLRDVLGWLESRAFGLWAPAWHTVSVLLYLGAVLLLRSALLRSLGASFGVELASLLFALHPVHVESVAWLAGQKDILALLFVCAALHVHAGHGRARPWLVPLLVLGACLSKSMSVAVIVLLGAQDLVQKRKIDLRLYAATLLVVAGALALHMMVGRIVGMVTAPAGGSRYTALITMGPVWLEYLKLAFLPCRASIAHDVPDRLSWDVPAALGYVVLAAWLAYAVTSARRGSMKPAYTFAWFLAPLAPVSQVLMPLQNRMADRYAWLSVLVPCLLAGFAVDALRRRMTGRPVELATGALSAVLVGTLFVLTFQRATLFGDAVLLFMDGTLKTESNAVAPYQLGRALEAAQRDDEALVVYQEVLARTHGEPVILTRRASNALASIHARHGRLGEAERVLRAALARFPGDPTVRNNLAKVLRGLGRTGEAAALEVDAAPVESDEH